MDERYEFDEVNLLSAFAVGVPGKRTFFLLIGEEEEWIRLWLEKEQLEVLALAVEQLMVNLSHEGINVPQGEEGQISPGVPSGLPSTELEIDQMALGFEDEKATLEFLVHGSGPQSREGIVVRCRANLAQLKRLGDQGISICAAGRPRCKLCGGPIDPTGHTCPKIN